MRRPRLHIGLGLGLGPMRRRTASGLVIPDPPSFFGAGAVTGSSTTTATPPLPENTQAGDVVLCWAETHIADAAGATFTDQQGYAEIPNSPQASATATLDSRLQVFWKRLTGTDTPPTFADAGNHIACQLLVFRGCVATGNPWDITAGAAVETTATATVSVPGGTTTKHNCRIVAFCSTGRDIGTELFSGWANGDLTDVAEIADGSSTEGNGGGCGVASGVKATAGLFGATTASDLVVATGQGRIMVALRAY